MVSSFDAAFLAAGPTVTGTSAGTDQRNGRKTGRILGDRLSLEGDCISTTGRDGRACAVDPFRRFQGSGLYDNEQADMKRMIDTGVDTVITDNPEGCCELWPASEHHLIGDADDAGMTSMRSDFLSASMATLEVGPFAAGALA